jgi:DNA polymerase III beta subunit, central domain
MKALFALKASKYLPITAFALYQNGKLTGTDLEAWVEQPIEIVGLPNDVLIKRDWLKAVIAATGPALRFHDGSINGIPLPVTDMTAAEFPKPRARTVHDISFSGRLNADVLKGVARAAAADDVRYYLNGVFIDAEHNSLVATDGHRMHALRDIEMIIAQPIQKQLFAGQGRHQNPGRDGCIIPIAAINLILACSNPDNKVIDFSYSADTRFVVMSCGSTTVGSKTIDGQFPDWQRIVPVAALAVQPAPGEITGLKGVTLDTAAATKAIVSHMKIGKATESRNRDEYYKHVKFMNGRLNGMANTATDSVVVTGIEYIGLHGEYVLDAFKFLDASEVHFSAADADSSIVCHLGQKIVVIMRVSI